MLPSPSSLASALSRIGAGLDVLGRAAGVDINLLQLAPIRLPGAGWRADLGKRQEPLMLLFCYLNVFFLP